VLEFVFSGIYRARVVVSGFGSGVVSCGTAGEFWRLVGK
jgi:hypothetical protein